jgi:hypothetical protein
MTMHQPFSHSEEVKVVFRLTDPSSSALFHPCDCSLFLHSDASYDSLPLVGDLPADYAVHAPTVPPQRLAARSHYTIVSDSAQTAAPAVTSASPAALGAGLYSRLTAAVRDTLLHPEPSAEPAAHTHDKPDAEAEATETFFLEAEAGVSSRLDADASAGAAAGYIMAALVDGITPNAVLRAARKAHDVMENFVIPDVVDILAGAVDRQGLDAEHPCFKQGGGGAEGQAGAAPAEGSFLEVGARTQPGAEGGGEPMPTDDELSCPAESFQVSRAELLRPGLIAHKIALNLASVSPIVIQEMTDQAFAALAVDLHPILTERLRDPLAAAAAQHVERELGDLLSVSVDAGVRAIVARTLPPLLLRRLTQALTHTGTRALGHALSASLSHTLSTSPQHEGACYACLQQQQRCDVCYADDELRTRSHVKGYYRHFFAGLVVNNGRWGDNGEFSNDGTTGMHPYASELEEIVTPSEPRARDAPVRTRPPTFGGPPPAEAPAEEAAAQ